MVGNILLFILIAGALLYLWHLLSSMTSGEVFNKYRSVSFFAIMEKEYERDFVATASKILFIALKIILLIIILGKIDIFAFSQNPHFFTGYSDSQVSYEGLFYGIFVWEILNSLERSLIRESKLDEMFEGLIRPLFLLLLLFSFIYYYQTPFSDYVVLRQQETIIYGIMNLGCVSHFFFFLLFFFYIAYDPKQLGDSIVQSKIGLLNCMMKFSGIFILQVFIVYAFLGWTSHLPFAELLADRFPNSRSFFEVISLFVKLGCIHFLGILVGQFLGNIKSIYVRGIEKYLQLLSAFNAVLLIGIRLW